MVDVINVRKMVVDVDVAMVEDVLKVKSAVEEVETEAYVIIAENKIVNVVSLVINVVPVTVENVAMVENVDEVVQDVVVQASVEVGPEDIKAGSLLVLFFAYLSDK